MTSTMSLPPQLPERCLVVLIGASGAGKSTLASTWPASQVLSLDALRQAVSDDPGDQDATADAVAALHLLLERRMARRLFTVIDATNVTPGARAPLVAAAKRHGMPAIALLVSTPASVCVERQGPRPANRTVPDDTVRQQHQAMVRSHPRLAAEGFNEVIFADHIHRLEPLLRRASDTRCRELGWDGNEGLGGLLLVRRFFGAEVLPLWRWRDNSQLANGDRVGEIRLGSDRMVFALRTDVDGDVGFDLLVACPLDDDCDAPAWLPVYSVTDLLTAHTDNTGHHADAVCTVHGGVDDVDQETTPDGRGDLDAQHADTVRM